MFVGTFINFNVHFMIKVLTILTMLLVLLQYNLSVPLVQRVIIKLIAQENTFN